VSTLRTLRKLVLGETWTLPLAVACALGGAALIRALAGGWWRADGGFVVLALIALAYLAATWRARPRRRAREVGAAGGQAERDAFGYDSDGSVEAESAGA
jgi:membrane protein implicated in regulation of membrane protease activity